MSLRLSLLLSLCFTSAAFGQMPEIFLGSIFPPGGKQGTSLEVEISGSDLDNAGQLLFSHEGITAAQVATDEGGILPSPRQVPNKFRVNIAANVPPGIYAVRTAGLYGVSNPRLFAVGNWEEVIAQGNNSLEKPTELAVDNAWASARADNGGMQYYLFQAPAGKRLLVQCLAQRIDSKMDASLVLLDAAGRELARSHNSVGLDPVIDFTAPAEGKYTIGVYDFTYGGGSEYPYRLSVSGRPQIDFIFPPAGQAGTSGSFTIYGRNLPGGKPAADMKNQGRPLESLAVNISIPAGDAPFEVDSFLEPREAGHDSISYKLDSPVGPSNSVRVGVSSVPVTITADDNHTADRAQAIAAPGEAASYFSGVGDQHWYTFEAKEGDDLWIECYCHRLGFVSDPYLLVQRVTKNDQGEESVSQVGEADDPGDRQQKLNALYDTTSNDPSFRFRGQPAGTYRIMVTDFGGASSDSPTPYRLSITGSTPDFRLLAGKDRAKAPGNNNNQIGVGTAVLRPGGASVLNVYALRRHGFDGEIEVAVQGLPGGVTCPGAILSGSAEEAVLVLSAEETAQSWSGPVQIIGKAKINGQEVVRNARTTELVWGVQNIQQEMPQTRLTRSLVLSVIEHEKAPITFAHSGEVVETCRGAKLDIPLKVTRRGEINGDIKLQGANLPPNGKVADLNVKGDQGEVKFNLDLSNNNVPAGSYTFCLKGDVKFKYARNPAAVQEYEARQQQISEAIARLADEEKSKKEAQDEEGAKAAAEQLKKAQQLKQAIDKQLDEAKKASQPKDLVTDAITSPIRLRIHDRAVAFQPGGPVTVKQKEKAMLPISFERLYGFDDAVEFSIELPGGVAGISGTVNIPKGQTTGMLEIAAAENAAPGEQSVTLLARHKYNNVQLDFRQPLVIKVETP